MSLTDAVDREEAWLSTEPLVPYPALRSVVGNDGPFQYIGARVRRMAQGFPQIHVIRERFVEQRLSTGNKAVRHDMLLGILWPKLLNSERADVELLALDSAIERVVIRVRDSLSAQAARHTHGTRFWSVGESGGVLTDAGIDVRYPDWRGILGVVDSPLAAGASYVVEIRYPAVEYVSG